MNLVAFIDLDLEPLRNLSPVLNQPVLLCNSPREHCQNNCIGAEKGNPLFLDLMKYSVSEYEKKKNIKVYDTWQSRFIIQTTGPKMMARFFKNFKDIPISKIMEVPDFNEYVDEPYLKDYCTKTWMPKVFYNNNDDLINS
jgi:mannosyltransferase OCH1-like enzyme